MKAFHNIFGTLKGVIFISKAIGIIAMLSVLHGTAIGQNHDTPSGLPLPPPPIVNTVYVNVHGNSSVTWWGVPSGGFLNMSVGVSHDAEAFSYEKYYFNGWFSEYNWSLPWHLRFLGYTGQAWYLTVQRCGDNSLRYDLAHDTLVETYVTIVWNGSFTAYANDTEGNSYEVDVVVFN